MRHTLDIYRRLLGVQLRSQLQYRVAFFMDILAAGLILILEFGSVALVLQRFEHIRGWTVWEVAFLYGMVEMAFGSMDLVFSGFDPGRFGQEVRRGTFDQLLLRPIHITVQVLGQDFALRRLGRIVVGAAIFGLAANQLQVDWTVAKILYLPLVIGGMFCFFGGLFMVGATITFWTVESIEVMNILTYGGSFTISYPMSIYQDWLRRILTFVVPAIFLNYYPTLYLLGKPDPYNFPTFAPFLSPLIGAVSLWLAHRFWRWGVRHYQSTGT